MLLWGLFVGAAAAVLAPVGPGALVPLKMAIASADSVGNDVYVAVVVDFGSGSSMSSVSKCVPVASNAHDSDALAAAVGAGNVAYTNSGLLCAIDNYPANGVQNCGQSVGPGDYDYWSYWHGSSGSWVYANNGPAEQSVSSPPNDVEGLRFQIDQPANGNDPPPSVAPAYAQICNASTEVPPAQTPSAAATTTTHHHGRADACVRDADNGEGRHRPRSGHDADHRGRHAAKVRCLDHDGGPGRDHDHDDARLRGHRNRGRQRPRVVEYPQVPRGERRRPRIRVEAPRAMSSRRS